MVVGRRVLVARRRPAFRGVVGRLLGLEPCPCRRPSTLFASRFTLHGLRYPHTPTQASPTVGTVTRFLNSNPRWRRRRVARLEHGAFLRRPAPGCEVEEHAPIFAWLDLRDRARHVGRHAGLCGDCICGASVCQLLCRRLRGIFTVLCADSATCLNKQTAIFSSEKMD